MKTLIAVLSTLVLVPVAHASEEKHRYKVPARSVVTFTLDKRYPTNAELYPASGQRTAVSIYERGQCPGPSDIVDTLGWTFRNGLLLEATQPDCKPGSITLRASNVRRRARWFTLLIVKP